MGQALSGAIMKLNGLRNELNDCIEFLSIFKKPLERLQSESHPTIHLVWDATLKLLHKATKFANNQEKSPLLQALGKSCQIAIQHKLDNGFITDTHRIAAFLDPRMRHMSHLSDEQRTELHELVRSKITAFPLTQRAPEQPLRHFVDDSDSDDEVIIRRADVPRNIDEVTNYIEDHFSETASPVFDPLNFWHTYEERYPKLSKLALRMFAVPASSASCERAFRRLKAIITENRQSLSPETVTKLMLSRSFVNSDASSD
ncbi:HAT dimerization [Aphelenchoides avenae]|nr:HAT dimerization [Aphelenchus avenae]